MQDLKVIGVDGGALLVSSEDGTRYRIPIDEVLQSKLRQASRDPGSGRKLAPREIQAHIRSGLSSFDVARITGVPLEYIQKFEGPVLAEREFVVESALNVPVHTALASEHSDEGSTFGAVIRSRLQDIGATEERWASWKDADGTWVVKLAFTANTIDHDARWKFEPKKAALAPLNSEANNLSQQGDLPGGLIPRLRAVTNDERFPDASRFDSGAFDSREFDDSADHGDAAFLESVPFPRTGELSPGVAAAAINRAPSTPDASSSTADLLDALRRRRGERETGPIEYSPASQDISGAIRIVDVPLGSPEERRPAAGRPASHADGRHPKEPDTGTWELPVIAASSSGSTTTPAPKPAVAKSRRNRASMPSWDEIVFGARSDDDHS